MGKKKTEEKKVDIDTEEEETEEEARAVVEEEAVEEEKKRELEEVSEFVELSSVKGVGKVILEKLNNAGIASTKDLLEEDLEKIAESTDIPIGRLEKIREATQEVVEEETEEEEKIIETETEEEITTTDIVDESNKVADEEVKAKIFSGDVEEDIEKIIMLKNRKKKLDLLKEIKPPLSFSEMKLLIEDLELKFENGKEKGDWSNMGEFFEGLSLESLQKLYNIFVSRLDKGKKGVKWRYYQYLKTSRDWEKYDQFEINQKIKSFNIDIVASTPDGKKAWIWVFEEISKKDFEDIKNTLKGSPVPKKESPIRMIAVGARSYRDIPIGMKIRFKGKNQTTLELWIEDEGVKRLFSDDDILLVNNDFRIAGFNFTRLKDLLDYVFRTFGEGQYLVERLMDFDDQTSNKGLALEKVWKGLLLKIGT